MSSLVTGGAGFIGSHVAEELSKLGQNVIVLDDLSGGFPQNVVGEHVSLVKGSVNDVELINRLFQQYRFEYVFHLAAYAAEGLSHFIKRFNYENNLIGSVNLINAAVNFRTKVFVFTSSIAVYGKNQVPMTENMNPQPEDPYGISKYAVELDLKETREMFGLDYIVFRPHNVYGERQNIGDPYRNVIGIFMNQILQGRPMTIFGDGQQTRAFTYIADVAPVIAQSVFRKEAYNSIFNIGADKPYSVNDLAHAVARAMGVSSDITNLPARNEVVHAFSSHERVKSIFSDIIQNIDLASGLSRMARWVKSVGARKGKLFKGIEVSANMPLSWKNLVEAEAAQSSLRDQQGLAV
jgi:UDP-glucose 4-epimerase